MKKFTGLILLALGIIAVLFNLRYEIEKCWNGFIAFDLYTAYVPYLVFAKESILSGKLPLWTPYQAVGKPFFAEMQHGFLYPVNWIALAMDIPSAMRLIQLLTLIISMGGMALYARRLKLNLPGTVLSGILVAYSVLFETRAMMSGSTVCWFPFILWATHRIFDKPDFGRCVQLAIFLLLSFLGGHAQLFYYMSLVWFFYVLLLTCLSWSSQARKAIFVRWALLGFACVLMIGLASIQLLPALELTQASVRNVAGENEFMSKAFLLQPGTLGMNIMLSQTGTKFASYYFGSTLLLLPFAVASKRLRPVVIGLLAGLVFVIIFVTSKEIPALAVLGKIPFASTFRFYTRILIFPRLLIAILAGIGLSELWQKGPLRLWNPGTRRLDWFWTLSTAYFLGVLCIAFLIPGESADRSITYSFLLLGGASLVLICLVFASERRQALRKATVWIIAAFVVMDVASHGVFAKPKPEGGLGFDEPFLRESSAWIAKNAGFERSLISSSKADFNVGSMFSFINMNSYSPYTLSRWHNFVRTTVEPSEFDQFHRIWPFYGRIGVIKRLFLPQAQMAGVASLKYFITRYPSAEAAMLDANRDEWKLIYSGGKDLELRVYENIFALPRAYLISNYTVMNDEEKSLEEVRKNVSELSWSVVLENSKPSFRPSGANEQTGRAQITEYATSEVELQVEANEPSLVILTDAYYPGWVAFVDGIEAPVLRANSLFRAVEVSAGNHTVVFKFQPASLRWGISVSSFTALLIVVGILWRRYQKEETDG